MSRYRVEKAEEGTTAVDALLEAGWEPFAVVSTPVEVGHEPVFNEYGTVLGSRAIVLGYVTVIWFRRVLP